MSSATAADRNARRLADAYTDFLNGDLSRLFAILSDDVRWVATGRGPVAGHYVGPAEVRAFFQRMWDVYGGTLQLEVLSTLADADYGVVLTHEHGVARGHELSYRSVHVYRFDADGRCTEFLALQDDAYDAFWDRHGGKAEA